MDSPGTVSAVPRGMWLRIKSCTVPLRLSRRQARVRGEDEGDTGCVDVSQISKS